MKNAQKSNATQKTPDEDPATKKARCIIECEGLVDKKNRGGQKKVVSSISEAISIYDNVFNDDILRQRAADIVCKLAKRYDLALDLVIENAGKYCETQHIDDASPYSPNSFNVLAKIGKGNRKVLSFLKNTAQKTWGIPRWAAIEALCELNDSSADAVIIDIIQGKYPPEYLDLEHDIRKIERIKGRSFVERQRS